jgi:hypothetical protein
MGETSFFRRNFYLLGELFCVKFFGRCMPEKMIDALKNDGIEK